MPTKTRYSLRPEAKEHHARGCTPPLISRRRLIQGAGLSVAGALQLLSGHVRSGTEQRKAGILIRKIPRTGESLPAVGLGTFMTFDTSNPQRLQQLREVVQRFWSAGGRVV